MSAYRVLDKRDLRFHVHEFAEFVRAASARHAFDSSRVIAIGYSNGVNIAASLLLLYPQVLHTGVLFNPLL